MRDLPHEAMIATLVRRYRPAQYALSVALHRPRPRHDNHVFVAIRFQ
jgi:hypothetical protein